MEITVVGTATASFPPERATVHVQLGFEGPDKQAVLTAATDLANRFGVEVQQLKEADPAPVTWSAVLPVGTRSWRPYSDTGQVLPMRYAAEAQAKVKFSDFAALSAFIDQWGGVEGVTVGWVEWALTEHNKELEEQSVLARAVESAEHRAQTMARAAGSGQVRFLELADPGLLHSGNAQPQAEMYGMAARSMKMDSSGGGGVDLTPEDVELSATVHARFTTD